MNAECWICGEKESFDTKKEFIQSGWSRAKFGEGGASGLHTCIENGEGRDYCPNHEREDKIKDMKQVMSLNL